RAQPLHVVGRRPETVAEAADAFGTEEELTPVGDEAAAFNTKLADGEPLARQAGAMLDDPAGSRLEGDPDPIRGANRGRVDSVEPVGAVCQIFRRHAFDLWLEAPDHGKAPYKGCDSRVGRSPVQRTKNGAFEVAAGEIQRSHIDVHRSPRPDRR